MNQRTLIANLFDVAAKLPYPVTAAVTIANAFRRRKLSNLRTPLWFTLYVTDRCNAKCAHCFYWRELNSRRYQVTIGDIEKIVASLRHKMHTVGLTGGEPFLRKDIADIYRVFDERRATGKVQISTHGGQVRQIVETLEKIVPSSKNKTLIGLSISLDGLRETHDTIRGWPGLFDKVVTTVRNVKELSKQYDFVSVGICTSVSCQNAFEVPALMDFVQNELGVPHGLDFVRSFTTDAYNVDPNIANGSYEPPMPGLAGLPLQEVEKIESLMRTRRRDKFQERLQVLRAYYATEIRKTHRRQFPCLAGVVDCVIYATGGVAFCEFTKPFANLRDYDWNLERLWNSPIAEQIRTRIQTCACTHPVNMVRSMAFDTHSLIRLARSNSVPVDLKPEPFSPAPEAVEEVR